MTVDDSTVVGRCRGLVHRARLVSLLVDERDRVAAIESRRLRGRCHRGDDRLDDPLLGCLQLLVQAVQASWDIRRIGARRPGAPVYWMCTPEMARATISRWISLVPSKIV
jgi:hypothetical protein